MVNVFGYYLNAFVKGRGETKTALRNIFAVLPISGFRFSYAEENAAPL
jgi:hypothetical protein